MHGAMICGRSRRPLRFFSMRANAIGVFLLASGCANGGAYPAKPIRLTVPSAPGGCLGSRRRGWCWGGDGTVTPGLWHWTQRWLAVAMLLLASLWVMPAVAQNYPSKPIRLIVPSAPGGGIDFTGRVLALKLSVQLGQPVVVDNRAGASGILGADTVAKATPDGYTLLVASSSLAVIPSLYKKLPYDFLRDFSAVSLAARTPNLLVVNPAVPAGSVSELIALAKAQPAKLNFSSSGAGRASHMAAERFKQMAGINLQHVAVQGTGLSVTAVIAGEVEVIFGTIPAVLPHVKSGRLRALGIGSLKRSGLIPEIPTIAETVLPGYETATWYSLVTP